MPTLGRVDALRRCLEAIAGGVVSPLEVIVVDQSATDDVAALLQELDPRGSVLRHVRSASRGLSAARNLGRGAATATVVAFTDDDCIPDIGWLRAVAHALDADPGLGAVTGPMLPFGPPDAGVPVSSRTSTVPLDFSGPARPWEVGTGGNTAVRADLLRLVHGYDERLGAGTRSGAGEDLDLFRRLLASGVRIRYEPAAVCRHGRVSPQERRARRPSYGRGGGVALGRWLRDRDPGAARAVVQWTALRTQRLLTGIRRHDRTLVREEWQMLRSTITGVWLGVRWAPWATAAVEPPSPVDR